MSLDIFWLFCIIFYFLNYMHRRYYSFAYNGPFSKLAKFQAAICCVFIALLSPEYSNITIILLPQEYLCYMCIVITLFYRLRNVKCNLCISTQRCQLGWCGCECRQVGVVVCVWNVCVCVGGCMFLQNLSTTVTLLALNKVIVIVSSLANPCSYSDTTSL